MMNGSFSAPSLPMKVKYSGRSQRIQAVSRAGVHEILLKYISVLSEFEFLRGTSFVNLDRWIVSLL